MPCRCALGKRIGKERERAPHDDEISYDGLSVIDDDVYLRDQEYGGERGSGGGPRRVGDGAGEAVRRGGVIDWGHHLGDVKQYGDGGRYDLVTDDVGDLGTDGDRTRAGVRPGHGPPRKVPPPPSGAAPASARDDSHAPIGGVEEALAILAKHKKEKKERKDKKAKKSKKMI